MKRVSPTSLKVIFRALKEGSKKNLKQVLDMEFDIVTEFMKQNDFYEGVRSVLVEKDNHPIWKPTQLKDVTKQAIDAYFPNV